jgi:uncharacterized coiled-coil protein SlyX
MSKELIERLRADAESTDDIGLCADAAERIEELERFIKEQDALLQELRPIIVTASDLRKERYQLRVHISALRNAIKFWMRAEGNYDLMKADKLFQEALASTPEQSLAEYRNKVIEECAAKLDSCVPIWANEMRAMKGQP